MDGRDRVVDVDGPVCVREWDGAGGRTIVCVHGLGSSRLAWTEVAPQLRRHGRVLAVDLPGFGRTPRAGRRATVWQARRLLGRFLAAQTRPPVVLFGTSFGGAVCALQAAREPASLQGLVLGSSFLPPVYGGRRAPAVLAAIVGEQVGRGVQQLRHRLLLPTVGADERSPLDVVNDDDAGLPQLPQPGPHELKRSSREAVLSLVAWAAAPWLPRREYDRIRCPVLVLHGEEDGQVPVAWAHAAARRPGWSLRVYPAVSHVVKLENPRWWSAVVDEWMHDLGGAVSPA